ncbi:hypothetical protein [Paraliomyxa miuraensis]|uniref:hypothetical protein n=1 Tax=Paraliomyxa miuraensis TaxID=376150 RepID=UPI00224D7825|nr:hypothetical protein [Paraliomyxa miuraensis]MCX4245199.1 hypothetical protein [Paraliomyxa miuraensis]
MCPPPKPRSSAPAVARAEPEGNLARRLPVPEPQPPPTEPSPSADELDVQLDPILDPGEETGGDPSGEHDEEPIAAGRLRWTEANAEQQERARAELQDRIAAYMQRARPRVVLTDNLHTMLSIKRGHGVLTFRLHHMFVGAPAAVIRAVARYAETQEREAANLLRDYVDANEPLIRRREEPRPVTLDVQGRWHNLQEIFDQLNAVYFDGAIKARITWGARGKRRRARDSIKLGSYTVEDELIRIHPVLDAKDVPRFFVEWIVYHEMLHEVHDMPVVDGRRVYHTAEFRRAETRFERYAEAVIWEHANLHKLLER